MIYHAIKDLMGNSIASKEEAQAFLDKFDLATQQQIIAAVYIGREHLHDTKLREMDVSVGYTDHINQREYANIVYEKAHVIPTYLSKLLECAENSGFDLRNL